MPLAFPALVLALAARSARGGPGGCEYSDGEDTWTPFVFWRRLPDGSRAPVQAERGASGLCVFAGASCETGGFVCCQSSPEQKHLDATAHAVNTGVCACTLMLPLLVLRAMQQCKKRKQPEAGGEGGGEPPAPGVGSLKCLGKLTFFTGVGANIVLIIAVAKMTQDELSVPMRNAMLASMAVLEPVREVFQFLEDAVTVQINLALGANALRSVRLVLRLGLLGGVLLGTLAASLVTGLSYWTSAAQYLLVPFSLEPSWAGCPLVPRPEQVVETARPYLLLMAWKWPFEFTNMALRGFMLGTDQLLSLGLLMLLEQGIALAGLFALFLPDPRLAVLGWVQFVGSAFATVFMLAVLVCQRDTRQKYIFGTSDSEAAQDEGAHRGEGAGARVQPTALRDSPSCRANAGEGALDVSWSTVVRDGFRAMILDVAVQLPVTIGVYVAGASFGIGPMYQISALQAAFPQYGMQWILGLTIYVRIVGTKLVGGGDYATFRDLFVLVLKFGAALAVVAAATVAPFRSSLSFGLAEQACEYASDSRCLPIYASVFGGDGRAQALQGWPILVFIPALMSVCLFRLLKAGLYACLEWDFMARAGGAALALVFAPAMAAACLSPLRGPAAVLAAMYLPQLALAAAFAVRLARNVRRRLSSRPAAGPSSAEGARSGS